MATPFSKLPSRESLVPNDIRRRLIADRASRKNQWFRREQQMLHSIYSVPGRSRPLVSLGKLILACLLSLFLCYILIAVFFEVFAALSQDLSVFRFGAQRDNPLLDVPIDLEGLQNLTLVSCDNVSSMDYLMDLSDKQPVCIADGVVFVSSFANPATDRNTKSNLLSLVIFAKDNPDIVACFPISLLPSPSPQPTAAADRLPTAIIVGCSQTGDYFRMHPVPAFVKIPPNQLPFDSIVIDTCGLRSSLFPSAGVVLSIQNNVSFPLFENWLLPKMPVRYGTPQDAVSLLNNENSSTLWEAIIDTSLVRTILSTKRYRDIYVDTLLQQSSHCLTASSMQHIRDLLFFEKSSMETDLHWITTLHPFSGVILIKVFHFFMITSVVLVFLLIVLSLIPNLYSVIICCNEEY